MVHYLVLRLQVGRGFCPWSDAGEDFIDAMAGPLVPKVIPVMDPASSVVEPWTQLEFPVRAQDNMVKWLMRLSFMHSCRCRLSCTRASAVTSVALRCCLSVPSDTTLV